MKDPVYKFTYLFVINEFQEPFEVYEILFACQQLKTQE
jgi:hypothetical protein